METEGRPLVTLALDGIDRLDGDDAKEEALRMLGSVLAGSAMEDALAEASFTRLLDASHKLEAPWTRTRAFADACESIGCSRMPRAQRVDLLVRALELARAAETTIERIDRSRAAIEALAEVQRDEVVEEGLERLATEAAAVEDARARHRTICQVSLAIAKFGECSRAVAILDALPPSAARARALSHVCGELVAAGEVDEAAALMEAILGEIREEPESYELALALRDVLATLLEHDLELPRIDGIATALDLVDRLHDARFRKDALLGAIGGLAAAPMEPAALEEAIERLRQSVERVEETYTRAPLLGELAVALASRGDGRGAERALGESALVAARAERSEIVDALGDPAAALPVPRVLAALADDEDPSALHASAMRLLEVVRGVDEPGTVASIVRQCAQLFASPALPYDYRVRLLDRALWVAQGIRDPDACVEAASAIANALSLAGATERGDGLFAGLVLGIDPRAARKAHLERAVTLVRLGRTAEAREQLVLAAESAGGDTWHAMEALAKACAQCGFIGDVIGVLSHVEAGRQVEARTAVADLLAETSYIDPALRVIGLESIASDAGAEVACVVAVLVAEVRMLEKMGDPDAALAKGLAHLDGMENRAAAAALEQQLVNAAIERLRRDNA